MGVACFEAGFSRASIFAQPLGLASIFLTEVNFVVRKRVCTYTNLYNMFTLLDIYAEPLPIASSWCDSLFGSSVFVVDRCCSGRR